MANCANCGASDQHGRFCMNCGSPVEPPSAVEQPSAPATWHGPVLTDTARLPAGQSDTGPTVNLQKDTLADLPPAPADFPSVPSRLPSGPPAFTAPPTQNYPTYTAGPGQDAPPLHPSAGAAGAGGRRRGWLIAAAAFVVVIALATTAVLVLQRSADSADSVVDGPVEASTAAPATAGPPDVPQATVTASRGAAGPPVGKRSIPELAPATTATATITAGPTAPATPPPAPVANPLGGPSTPIACGAGYIVQIASELDFSALSARVAQIDAARTLPSGAKWTETAGSCPIFTTQANVEVLYAGPFFSAYDACPARLASPPDAFIKGTTPGSDEYVSCLCPATVSTLPTIGAVGQQGVWVGELQRVLGTGLDYGVGSINADPATGNPGQWGTYTADTAAAVGRFQSDNALPVNQVVDAATWSVLQRQSC